MSSGMTNILDHGHGQCIVAIVESEPETVGQRIARLRGELDMSRGELGLAIQSTAGRQLIAAWEAGSVPSGRWIAPLAAALKCTCDYLLTGRSVWVLDTTEKYDGEIYGVCDGFVVAAGSESEARDLAAEYGGWWKDPELSTCVPVTTESGIVMKSFHHG